MLTTRKQILQSLTSLKVDLSSSETMAKYGVDWLKQHGLGSTDKDPIVLLPKDEHQVGSILKHCNKYEIPVVT